MIKGSVKGIKNFSKAIKSLETDILSGQIAAVRESTLLIHDHAVRSLQDNTDGPRETRYRPKRDVNVSKPGEPPNTDKGRAVKSIKFEFDKGGMIGRVGTNLKYLAALEFGTKHIEPRPWLSRAVKIASSKVADIFEKSVKKAIKENKK